MADERVPEPADGDEHELLVGWLAFHRDVLAAKCDRVAPDDLIHTGLGGTTMSLLGLVRHLTEMERVYGTWALGGGGPLEFVYGPYEEGTPDGDFDELTVAKVGPSFAAWHDECAATDRALAAMAVDEPGRGNRRTVRWNLTKLMQEYARHNGHADLIRQSIDGVTGE